MTYSWLLLERMEFAISQGKCMTRVLVVMGECAVTLGHVESKDSESDGADELFLEGAFLLVGGLVDTFSCQQVVLALVELFLDFSSEHLLFINNK